MAAQKKTPQQIAGRFLADQARQLAKDPELHRAVISHVAPAATGAGKLAKNAAARVRLPQKSDPFDEVEAALSVVETMINEQARDLVDADTVAQWRQRLASLRTALPLARADEGKGRKQKLKDLRARQHALLDDVYTTVVSGGTGEVE